MTTPSALRQASSANIQRAVRNALETLPRSTVATGTVPAGGSSGQALVKVSATDYDTTWSDVAGAGIGLDGGAPDTVFGAGMVDGGSP
jgi:hypothetical protein